MNSKKTVYLGMSGGVDSSLSAVLLKEQGYNVIGVYMKNWSRDLPGMKCPWAEDLADAKRVAVRLGIDFKVFDFETEYKQKVVDYMLEEFKKGRTPNPDIMCNQEIKFKLFYEVAKEQGADLIATGHYARIGDFAGECQPKNHFHSTQTPYLRRAIDDNKDQTYFLYRISSDAIAHTLFPIGHLKKSEVKRLAAEKGLENAYKKESMGICFVGDVSIRDFLKEYFPPKLGPIVESETGKELGVHDGAVFYTIGQRHGLDLGSANKGADAGLPYYVVKKDVLKNVVYVSRNLNAADLWTTELDLEDIILRLPPKDADLEQSQLSTKELADSSLALDVRLRHRAPLIPARLEGNKLIFKKPIKRPASGQSAVFYLGDICLGGGIIK